MKRAVPKKGATRRPSSAKAATKKAAPKRTIGGTKARTPAARPSAQRSPGRQVSAAKGRVAHGPAVKPPFPSYKGKKGYLFVSYSHRDMRQVFSATSALNDRRYRVWYDEGIEPGNEWPEVVGRAVIRCSQFLVFMSRAAARSRNVRNEINLAHSENKDILVVFLEKTNLSEGMRLQIGTVQFLNKYELKAAEFLTTLTGVLDSRLRM